MNHSPGSKQVALAFPVAVPWMALCMRGIIDYAQQQHEEWNLLTSPPTLIGAQELALTPACLQGWEGDGIIALINDRKEANDAARLKLPVVCIGGTLRQLRFPRVMVDQYAMGRLAAEHLLQCGFQRLGFYGLRGLWYNVQRRRGFVDCAAEAGVECKVLEQPVPDKARISWQQRLAPLDAWLKTLKTPVGILAVHDYRARILVEECHRLGLVIPHEVAIIGVDNDMTVCEYCKPTISSVSRSAWEMGFKAAAQLDRMMAGKPPESQEIIIPPDGVIARGSTDTIAVEDPYLRAAIRFMRDRIHESISMEQILAEVPISRRLLEERFRQFMNDTPHNYLCRLRMEKAKAMLTASPRMKIRVIAKVCGFSSQDHMRLIFLRLIGMTPTQYRHKLLSEKGG